MADDRHMSPGELVDWLLNATHEQRDTFLDQRAEVARTLHRDRCSTSTATSNDWPGLRPDTPLLNQGPDVVGQPRAVTIHRP